MSSKKGFYIAISILSVLSLALSAALIFTIIIYENEKNEVIVPVITEPEEEEELPEEESFTITTLKEYASQFGTGTEFLQQFFENEIVYKYDGEIIYEPIDDSLPLHKYSFENLLHTESEILYSDGNGITGIKGIDVSKYQGDIDWNKVKADGVEYALLRLGFRGYGSGEIVIDDYFYSNVKGALAAGVKVGVYFYSQAITTEEAVEEAEYVINAINNYDIEYPVIFDVEEVYNADGRADSLTKEERTEITIAFCEAIEKAGYKPMIYANIIGYLAQLDLSKLTMYDKWFAQYYQTPFFPYDFQIWQYTESGTVDGIDGSVDLNICFKDYSIEENE